MIFQCLETLGVGGIYTVTMYQNIYWLQPRYCMLRRYAWKPKFCETAPCVVKKWLAEKVRWQIAVIWKWELLFGDAAIFHWTVIMGGRVSLSKSKRFTREMYDKVVTFVCLEELGMTTWPPSFTRFYLSIFQEGSSLGCPGPPKKTQWDQSDGGYKLWGPEKVALWMGNWGYNIYLLDRFFCLVIFYHGLHHGDLSPFWENMYF